MSNNEFDWTTILPDAERRKALADRKEFFDSFPTKEEVEQAGREGRAAFAKACAQVDRTKFRRALHTLLADAVDNLGLEVVKAQLKEATTMVDLIPSVAITAVSDNTDPPSTPPGTSG